MTERTGSAPPVSVGQVWQRRDESRVRVEGFSKTDRGWVKVREVGGDRSRSSYPPTVFTNGSFVLVGKEDAPGLSVVLSGPQVTPEATMEAGEAMVRLLEEVGRSMGTDVKWALGDMAWLCDGCGFQSPGTEKPADWLNIDGNDYCGTCQRGTRT